MIWWYSVFNSDVYVFRNRGDIEFYSMRNLQDLVVFSV